MGKFVQLVVDGLSTGSVYGALALAIVLVHQATGLINFAQGGMAVLAAYVAWCADEPAACRSSSPSWCRSSSPSCSAPWSSGG